MSDRDGRRRSPRRDEAKTGTRRQVLTAAMEVFAREGYHAARMDAIVGGRGRHDRHAPRQHSSCRGRGDRGTGRLRALAGLARHRAHRVGQPRPAYANKRREALGRFATLERHHLDKAVGERSIPPLEAAWAPTRGRRAQRGVIHSLQGELPGLPDTVPALSARLLRSVGAADAGPAAGG